MSAECCCKRCRKRWSIQKAYSFAFEHPEVSAKVHYFDLSDSLDRTACGRQFDEVHQITVFTALVTCRSCRAELPDLLRLRVYPKP